jgi:hypothetical protein
VGKRRRIATRWIVLACAPAALLGVPASAAGVAVGEVAPVPVSSCDGGIDALTPDPGGGNGYVVPSTGGIGSWTLTSWRTNASSEPGQSLQLKIFRKVGDPATFTAVSHEQREDLHPGLNSFATSLRVSSGDLVGIHFEATTAGGACVFTAPGTTASLIGDLAVGAAADFNVLDNPLRINLAAEVTPTNSFTLGKLKRRRNGTAVLNAVVPNPGTLVASGKGVRSPVLDVPAAGPAALVIRAKGKRKRRLVETGKVKLKASITFTPAGGAPSTLPRKVKLRRK